MSDELKPCPFCGCKARLIEAEYQAGYRVQCDRCGGTQYVWCDGKERQIEKWNNRTKRTFTQEDVERVALAISEHHSGNGSEAKLIAKAALETVGRVEE